MMAYWLKLWWSTERINVYKRDTTLQNATNADTH